MLKTCSKCGKAKPLGEFHNQSRNPNKKRTICKYCANLHRRKISSQNHSGKNYRIALGIQEKCCVQCQLWKPFKEFHKSKRDGHRSKCKICRSKEGKRYYYATIEHQQERTKKYRKANPEVGRAGCKRHYYKYQEHHCARAKKWRKNNPEKVRRNQRRNNKKERATAKGKLNHSIGTALWAALSGREKGRKWQSLVGYSIQELKTHLDGTMPDGYSWQDYIEGKLHLHHIIPRNFFKFENAEDVEFRMCWRLENLALLPAEINWSLKDKIILRSA